MPAYYCFFPGDYLRDTIHLGQLEDLAYRRLLDLYYAKGRPLANDRGYIMRAIRANDPDLQNAADNVLAEFFTLNRDGWRNDKADRELEYMQSRSEKAKRAINIRWERERNKNKELSDTHVLRSNDSSITPTPTPTPTPTLKSKTNTTARPQNRGTRLPPGWIPGAEGTQFCKDERPDLDVRDVFEEFTDYWQAAPGPKGVKLDWMATWRNWVRRQKARA